jgi:hypothetical protein
VRVTPPGRTGAVAVSYQGNQYPAVSRVAAPPKTYSSYGNSLPRDDTVYSQSYGGISSGGAPYPVFGAGAGPYRSSMVEPSPVGNASTMPFFFSTYGGHFKDMRGPGADPHPIPPTNLHTPHPFSFGRYFN